MAYILNKTCADCALYIRTDGTAYGTCRRYPPAFDATSGPDPYPIVKGTLPSCGEYAPKP